MVAEIPSWAIPIATAVASGAATWGAMRVMLSTLAKKLDEVGAEVKELSKLLTRVEVMDARVGHVEREVEALRDAHHGMARDIADLRAGTRDRRAPKETP